METCSPISILAVFIVGASFGAVLMAIYRQHAMEKIKAAFEAELLAAVNEEDIYFPNLDSPHFVRNEKSRLRTNSAAEIDENAASRPDDLGVIPFSQRPPHHEARI